MTIERTPLPQAGSCCSSNGATIAQAAASEDLAVCPVMGSTIPKAVAETQGLFRDYNGTRYWFCCAGCGPAFGADPQEYATAPA
jgi:YHS domain-containing protein